MAPASSRGSERDRRQAILVSLRAGNSAARTVELLKLSKATVYRVAKQWELSEEHTYTGERRKHERKRPKRTSKLLQSVENRLSQDHHVSCRKLAKEFKVGVGTMRRVVLDDLGRKSLKPRVRQLLSESAKATRVVRCKKLLNNLKRAPSGRLLFFSDEKIFTVDQKINRQNDRCHVQCSGDVCVVQKTKFPASVHVLAVVSSEGHKMPPHFFAKDETVTADVYLRVLSTVIKPWMDKTSNGDPYVYQQDGAPAHTSRKVQAWLAANVPEFWAKDMWPPNSPDLNPLDFYVWGELEARTNKQRHPNTDSLRLAIQLACRRLSKASLKKACKSFRSRLEAVVANDGGYIE